MAMPDKDGPATFKSDDDRAKAALDALQLASAPKAELALAELIVPLRAALARYDSDFAVFSQARLAAAGLYEEQMRPQIKTMQGQLDSAVASLRQSFTVDGENSCTDNYWLVLAGTHPGGNRPGDWRSPGGGDRPRHHPTDRRHDRSHE